jgi:hypothetical protein
LSAEDELPPLTQKIADEVDGEEHGRAACIR